MGNIEFSEPGLDVEDLLSIQRMQGPTIPLSSRERQVLIGVARGRAPKEVATDLGIEPSTVHVHTLNLRKKLMEQTTKDALSRAIVTGEISTQEIFPGQEIYLPKLRPSEYTALSTVAENRGFNKEVAKILGKAWPTIMVQLASVREKIGAVDTIHATALYFANKDSFHTE